MKTKIIAAFILSVGISGVASADNTVRFLGEVSDQRVPLKLMAQILILLFCCQPSVKAPSHRRAPAQGIPPSL